MHFKSLSATALTRGINCPASFKATHIDHAADETGTPALLGTAVHDALEDFVRRAYLERTIPATLEQLTLCYRVSFQRVFGALDTTMSEWSDGLMMLAAWMSWKQDFSTFSVISLENKREFLVPLPGGISIPFRYKFDREDQLSEKIFRVVDYKTQRVPVSHDDLKSNIQARSYGLAAQILHPEAERIWVQFDLLRFSSVGAVFTKEENKETWHLIKAKARELWLMEEPEERLNADCRYCVRKASCETLKSNILTGGIESITNVSDLIDLKYKVDSQIKGLASLESAVDERILKQAEADEVVSFDGQIARVEVGLGRGRRQVTDRSEVHKILGSELAADYANFLIGDIEKMEKDPRISSEQMKAIKRYVQHQPGKLTIRVKKKY